MAASSLIDNGLTELAVSSEAEGLRAQHPLLGTYDSLRTENSQFALLVDNPEGEGWVRLDDVVDLGTGELVRLVDQVGAHNKMKGRSAPAVLFFGGYAYIAIAMCATTYLAYQRVPLLPLGDMTARFDAESDIQAIAVNSYRFAALPSDPAADHPDCLVVESPEALRDVLREHLIAHLEPLLLATHQATKAGKPAMWALAQDYVGSAFSWIGRTLGCQTEGIAESLAINGPPSKLHRDKGFVHIEHCGQEYYMVDRLSCCLYYKSPEGHYCSTCPHRPMDERIDMIKNWLATLAKPELVEESNA